MAALKKVVEEVAIERQVQHAHNMPQGGITAIGAQAAGWVFLLSHCTRAASIRLSGARHRQHWATRGQQGGGPGGITGLAHP
jgi:hypothetical protein